MSKKGNPIPTRYDDDLYEMILSISEATGLPKSEIVRRGVKFALEYARTHSSLDHLLGTYSDIRAALGGPRMAAENPADYKAPPKKDDGDGRASA